MKTMFDLIVVGGGPIGGFVAKELAAEGYTVAIFEQRKEIGNHLGCAGLVSERVFDFIKKDDKIIQNEIKGAHIHSPSGNILTIGGDKIHAYAIDRQAFDKSLVNAAVDNNTNLFVENRVTSIQTHQEFLNIVTSKHVEAQCKLLIGADGPQSVIRDRFFIHQPTEMLHGIGTELCGTKLDPDFVEIFLGSQIAPGFFAWIIPINKDGTRARIGLCTSPEMAHSPASHYFSYFLKNEQNLQYFPDNKIQLSIRGLIPIGPLKKTYSSHILLVGDSAAQVKPTSGGGIYTGLVCARHCVAVVKEALQKNNYQSEILKKYHRRWVSDVGRELQMGMKFRKIFKHLSDDQMDKYITKFQQEDVCDIINKYGDIDYPSKLMTPLLKKIPFLISLLPAFLK